jgi:hypothetical protein
MHTAAGVSAARNKRNSAYKLMPLPNQYVSATLLIVLEMTQTTHAKTTPQLERFVARGTVTQFKLRLYVCVCGSREGGVAYHCSVEATALSNPMTRNHEDGFFFI